jgi:hypothetical protein
MVAYLQHAKLLLLCELKSLNGFNDSDSFLFQRAMEQSRAVLGIRFLVREKIISDSAGRFTEHVRDYGIQGDIANGKAILEAILLAGAHRDEFIAVTRKFTKDAYLPVRDETALDEAETEKLADPFGIFYIVLVAFDGFDPFGVDDDDVQIRFQHVKDRNPVFTCRFHTYIIAVIFNEPKLKSQQVFVKGGETFFLIRESS